MSIIEYCDEHRSDVISSVHFLRALVKRAGDEEHIIWALEGLLDHYRMGYIDKGHLGCNKLTDCRQSYIEVLNRKLDVKKYLLYTWLPRSGLHADHIKLISDKLDSYESVRCFVDNYPELSASDNSWQC